MRRSRTLAAAIALLVSACATSPPPASTPLAIAPPAPARDVPPLDDADARVRFQCAVDVQRAQDFDPGASMNNWSLIGILAGAFVGSGLGALFGLIGNIPGEGAAVGAIVGGGTGAIFGGQFGLQSASAAYARGFDACLAAHGAGTRPVASIAPAPGVVEYRLRMLSLRHEAFASFLTTAELADGATGPGLMRLASTVDSGALERGVVLYDRHIVPAPAAVARAFGATAVDTRVKLGGAGHDYWDEARWLGRPGERTVWVITPRMRRSQEVRRVGLSDVAALAQFRPLPPPLIGGTPQAAVTVPMPYLHRAEEQGDAGAYVDRALDRSRGISVLIAANSDAGYPDRVYLVVTNAVRSATYEAVLAWGRRYGEEREIPRE